MARLVPADEIDVHLSKARGWLEEDDPFFEAIDRIMQDRGGRFYLRSFFKDKGLKVENWCELD